MENPTSIIVQGGLRLSREQETALNVMIKHYGGEHEGQQLWRLGWAAEDNHNRLVPLCFHPNPLSYHILSWEPPTSSLLAYEHELDEDLSKGTWNCICHFEDENGVPFAPTQFVIEKLIPIFNRAHECAKAAMLGDRLTVEKLRNKKKDFIREQQKTKEKAWESRADALLNDAAPAFNGNPMSSSSVTSGKQLSDLKSAPKSDQPTNFDFTLHLRPPKDK